MNHTYAKKGITTAKVCQFCKDCGWKSSDAHKFLLAANLMAMAKTNTYIDDNPRILFTRFPGIIIQKINLN